MGSWLLDLPMSILEISIALRYVTGEVKIMGHMVFGD
jgi:hypothetical protein